MRCFRTQSLCHTSTDIPVRYLMCHWFSSFYFETADCAICFGSSTSEFANRSLNQIRSPTVKPIFGDPGTNQYVHLKESFAISTIRLDISGRDGSTFSCVIVFYLSHVDFLSANSLSLVWLRWWKGFVSKGSQFLHVARIVMPRHHC